MQHTMLLDLEWGYPLTSYCIRSKQASEDSQAASHIVHRYALQYSVSLKIHETGCSASCRFFIIVTPSSVVGIPIMLQLRHLLANSRCRRSGNVRLLKIRHLLANSRCRRSVNVRLLKMRHLLDNSRCRYVRRLLTIVQRSRLAKMLLRWLRRRPQRRIRHWRTIRILLRRTVQSKRHRVGGTQAVGLNRFCCCVGSWRVACWPGFPY
jgi:hypothetical protein